MTGISPLNSMIFPDSAFVAADVFIPVVKIPEIKDIQSQKNSYVYFEINSEITESLKPVETHSKVIPKSTFPHVIFVHIQN